MRWRIDLSYDGTDFHGWARQPGLRTVQGVLEEWIPKVLRLDGTPELTVAGRTDAGVHARGQVCHVDLPDDPELGPALLRRLRRVLPADLAIRNVTPAPGGFDARFSAIWRHYCYRVIGAEDPPDPLLRNHIVALRRPLDVALLNEAADTLLGLRDFAAFCKARDGATTIRELSEFHALRRDDGVIEIHLRADAFCHSMVRALVGATTAVAEGRRSLPWLRGVATAPVRHPEVSVMPAHGLTLEEVGYPADDLLAARAQESRAVRTLDVPEEMP